MFTSQVDKKIKYQKGFGLLEVLVAVVVLAVGIMALASFQVGLIRSSSDANARTIATSIAQGQLETLRAFNDTNQFLLIDDMNTPIETTQSGTTFELTWDVDPFPTATNPTYKRVTVNVAWTDPTDSEETISLESFINFSNPMSAGSTFASESTGERSNPTAGFNPALIQDGLPLPSGEDNLQISTAPEVNIVTAAGNRQVSFDEITYQDTAYNAILKRDAFRVVNCYCEFNAEGNALTPAFLKIYENDNWIPNGGEWKEGQIVTKKIGIASSTGGGPSAQPELCKICCRDHHDPNERSTNSYDYYDPFRHIIAAGNHEHYSASSMISPSTTDYLESCRFVRINGIWRVAQDLRLESLQIFPRSYISSGTENIRNYVLQFVKQYIEDIDSSSYPGTTPDLNPAITDGSDLFAAWEELPNIESTDDVNDPPNDQTLTSVSPSPTSTTCPDHSSYCLQVIARAIYIDFMDSEWIVRLRSLEFDPAIDMDKIPVREVNVTKLARWAKEQGTVNIIDEGISTSPYTRGLVHGLVLNTNSWIRAHIKRSNSGFTDSLSIDPDDDFPAIGENCSYPYPYNDYLNIVMGASSRTPAIQCPTNTSGTIAMRTTGSPSRRAIGGISIGNLTISSPDPDADCNPSLLGSGTSSAWSCFVGPSESFFRISITGYTRCVDSDPRIGEFTIYDNKIHVVTPTPTGWSYEVSLTGDRTINDTSIITFTKGPEAASPPYRGFNIEIEKGEGTPNPITATGTCPVEP